jgi:DNA-directed RNA polymerase specialized sigma subunit
MTNKEFLAEVIECKKKGEPSTKLVHGWQKLIAQQWLKRYPKDHHLREDCESFAMLMLIKSGLKFMPEKSNNPRAFFIQCICGAFVNQICMDKHQRIIG